MVATVTPSAIVESSLVGVENLGTVSGSQKYAHDLKFGLITLPATTDTADYVSVNLFNRFGMKRFLGVKGWRHSTTDSVIVAENPTTAVDNGVLVLTVLAGTGLANQKRVYLVIGV